MTTFDAHLPPEGEPSTWNQAKAMIRARPGVVIASVVAAATISCLGLLVMIAGQEVRFQASRAGEDVRASVFLRPATSRAAAQALKERLDALPFVRDASLHTKETAIVALETSGLPQPRSNPLPDVWVVTLKSSEATDAARPLTDRVAEARQALARLPDVEAVDVDAEWVLVLDRWQSLAATLSRGGLALLFPLVWLLVGCVFFLTGRGLASDRPDSVRRDHADRSAPTIVGTLVGVATWLASGALLAAAALGAESFGLDWKPIAARVGPMSGEPAVALGLGVLALAVLIIAITTRRR